ncbi:conserved Plasmodium protein, unknown function [Plasmodium knowlesi strain H]|uniref:Uncharacterized protein n=3 Tax=Plasmodium knowlesi TaxID=5850 RepID=A0A5K1VGH9_PLAKH|nr:conserved Plasmodium protein, unknown function [Plasmodium knowlesi strain H]OTN66519.1 Uncharacterized protein PKNOH_S09546000 [Plasmodium knowlesi]CAA9989854.1 conserved Plasmodium protein, unknown function [Plasmodium knowlesi strain H]SBO24408.1 conserved Plasmodium protein, unknown function [Plasmodium knowlesi strain H]SBO26602.1 conserved Plasmodium protein, unknown function [Plasmodium knowlesi strain H]VVS79328.1 conserved Plasmodium protein, unknown function [Plasmodium knowlesi s|eukprot:XP_002259869.1 hypothetical protein, conserved in Plasmodium species [Plasmodium knowlesi strain H]
MMSLNEETDINKLIEERNEWVKKYESAESECAILKEKLDKITLGTPDKNEQLHGNDAFRRDISMKYKYMQNQCEFLSVQLNILTLEKEKEVQKNQELQATIDKQKNEIKGYQKILEKLKNMNITFRKEKNETEKKICTIRDSDLLTRNDNVLLKEIVKINDKLIEVNEKIRDNVQEELSKAKTKLSVANDQIGRFSEAINNIRENFTKYKKKKENILLRIVRTNEQLKEELREKKITEQRNIQWNNQLEEYITTKALLNFYEAKYKMSDFILHTVLRYVSSIVNWDRVDGDKGVVLDMSNEENANYSILLKTLLAIPMGDKTKIKTGSCPEKEIYDEQMNTLRADLLSDNFPRRHQKRNKQDPPTSVENAEEDGNFLETVIRTNPNTSNIVEDIYYHIKFVNEILETVNVTLILLVYTHEKYLKDPLNHIHQEEYIQIQEKGNLRFAAYFFTSLSNFLLSVLKYVHIVRGTDRHAHRALLQQEYLFSLFCLCKYVLEEYVEKVRIKLFTSTIDYHILNVLSDKLRGIYDEVIPHVVRENNDRGEEEKGDTPEGGTLPTDVPPKYNNHMKRKNKMYDEEKNTKLITPEGNQNTDGHSPQKERLYEEPDEETTSLDVLGHLNLATGLSIMLLIEEDVYCNVLPDMDINRQKEIIKKCQELLKLVKAPLKISNFYFPIMRYKFSFKNFIMHCARYQRVVMSSVNRGNSTHGGTKSEYKINQLSVSMLDELKSILEDVTRMYSIDAEQRGDPYILQICDKLVEFYQDEVAGRGEISKEQKKQTILKENEFIKQLQDEVTMTREKINELNKQLNLLTIREEKYNKISIDLNVLKKEKNEYLNIIRELRESKNENVNEISHLTKHYNDVKRKYNDMLKNYEHKKKFYSTHKQMEPSNIDTYYMKKIINNLYYENFLTKLGTHYCLFGQSRYPSDESFCASFSPIGKGKKNAFYPTLYTHNEEDGIFPLTNEIGLHPKNISSTKDSYFTNEKHATLYDDIYNCEIIKGRIHRAPKGYFKNRLYRTNTTLQQIPTYREEVANTQHTIDIMGIIEKYKYLKNEIFTEMVSTPIGNNCILRGGKKKEKENLVRLSEKVAQLKYAIRKFHADNKGFGLNDEGCDSSARNVFTILFRDGSHSSQDGDTPRDKKITDGNKVTEGKAQQSSSNVILTDESFSYLLHNMFDL